MNDGWDVIVGIVGVILGLLGALLAAEWRFIRRHEFEREISRLEADRKEDWARVEKRLDDIDSKLDKIVGGVGCSFVPPRN